MVLITSLQDRLAVEIGAQVIARHRIKVELGQVREQNAELQATLERQSATMSAYEAGATVDTPASASSTTDLATDAGQHVSGALA